MEEYRTAVCLQNEKNLKSKVALMVKILRDTVLTVIQAAVTILCKNLG